ACCEPTRISILTRLRPSMTSSRPPCVWPRNGSRAEAVGMRAGFAAVADRLAAAVRTELGLEVHDRLNPYRLAAEYGIPVVPITALAADGASAPSIHQLTVIDRRCFSAGTILAGTARLIIFNPVHSDGRRANSITHELSHLLLEHPPGRAIGPGGCRVWDAEM